MNEYIYFDSNASTGLNDNALITRKNLEKYSYLNISNDNNKLSKKFLKYFEWHKKLIAFKLNVNPDYLYFTSGASESNITIFHIISILFPDGAEVITSSIEHKSLLEASKKYQNITTRYIKPNQKNNRITLDDIIPEINKNTKLISIMGSNNETGFINDIVEIANYAKEKKILIHSDITQYIGKTIEGLNLLNSFSSSFHKTNGPKGVGLFYCDFISENHKAYSLIPGTQQLGLRGGTINFESIISGINALVEILSNREEKNKIMLDKKNLILNKISENKMISFYRSDKEMPNTILFSLGSLMSSIKFSNYLFNNFKIIIGFGSACNGNTSSYVVDELNVSNNIMKLNIIRLSFDDYISFDACKFVSEKILLTLNRNKLKNEIDF